MNVYSAALILCGILTAAVTIASRGKQATSKAPSSPEFRRFQMGFLAVYYIAMTADWLQGPYVYALYSSYGFAKNDIAVLFVGGFGASMVFGTFVGAAADRLGRRKLCLLYCLLYAASCATKHGKDYWVLMLGRILGGVATSLLFSSFESWMVCEHNARGHDAASLSDTFSLMYFGNSLCAILAGLVAEAAADAVPLTTISGIWHYGGYCSPFDLSALCLIVAFALITATWGENYGVQEGKGAETSCVLEKPAKQMLQDARIMLIGVVVSLFEGSMYIFVFNWTPALSATQKERPPFGFIFAIFMIACMGGSSLFSLLSNYHKPESIMRAVFFVAAGALVIPVVYESTVTTLAGFCIFEACVGIYWPAIGTVKSQVVPEESRATIYNIFRIPLNAVVLVILLNNMAMTTAFSACAMMLICCGVAHMILFSKMAQGMPAAPKEAQLEEGASLGLISSSTESDGY